MDGSVHKIWVVNCLFHLFIEHHAEQYYTFSNSMALCENGPPAGICAASQISSKTKLNLVAYCFHWVAAFFKSQFYINNALHPAAPDIFSVHLVTRTFGYSFENLNVWTANLLGYSFEVRIWFDSYSVTEFSSVACIYWEVLFCICFHVFLFLSLFAFAPKAKLPVTLQVKQIPFKDRKSWRKY